MDSYFVDSYFETDGARQAPEPARVDTRGWASRWRGGTEVFTAPDGTDYVRVLGDEVAEVVSTPRARGLHGVRLVRMDRSARFARQQRRERRATRELRKRGYDV